VVSATKLPFLWVDMYTFLCNNLNFIDFLFTNVKKISQILESLVRKWKTLEQNGLATVAISLLQRESITHNSNFFVGPLQFELSQLHCMSLYVTIMEFFSGARPNDSMHSLSLVLFYNIFSITSIELLRITMFYRTIPTMQSTVDSMDLDETHKIG